MAQHWERISGSAAVALRARSSRLWTVVNVARIPDSGLPLGMQISLAKPDHARRDDPAVTRVTRWGFFAIRALPVPPLAVLVISALLLAAAIVAVFQGWAVWQLTVPPLRTFRDLGLTLLSIMGSWGVLMYLMAGMVSREIRGVSDYFYLFPLPRLEPVVWRLGISRTATVAPLSLAATLFLAAAAAFRLAPAIMLGVMVGSAAFFLACTFPLYPTPGARLLGALLRFSDLPRQLKWIMTTKLVVFGENRAKATPRQAILIMLAALGYFLLWIAMAGIFVVTFTFWPIAIERSVVDAWHIACALFALVYFLWLTMQILYLLTRGIRLRRVRRLELVQPDHVAMDQLREHSALLRHLPMLRDARWQWFVARAGDYLIEFDQRDRRFYWLTSGRAVVIARDENETPVHVATIGTGTGVGEIALIEDRARTADVVIEETALVAALAAESFEMIVTADARTRFREVVLAGQSISRSEVFFGMPDPDRERWIAYGSPRHYDPGDAIILQGSDDAWMGLLVSGVVAVERGDATIAELTADSVFGEIAHLTSCKRTATLRALEPTLVWRWEPDWLGVELSRAGILEALRELAELRLAQ